MYGIGFGKPAGLLGLIALIIFCLWLTPVAIILSKKE